eukprot:GHVQ01011560.1.p1 GENE.GHVQ01011560.1~~GHVQ01011560.1.p1  ORF type:complete len:405 (+),score=34.45 GHVQ01011560.1:1008-2222(+)
MQGIHRNPLHQAFITAGVQAGYKQTEDINGFQQEGFGRYQMTIGKGCRSSTAAAYLHPALNNYKNLQVMTNAFVEEILIENDRAVGVRVNLDNKSCEEVRCKSDVVLCGGAINSPHLLMLSGLGPRQELQRLGIETKNDLPGVGKNFQDHLEFYAQWECLKPVTLAESLKPYNTLRIGLQWLTTQTGEGASSHLESGAFTKSRPDIEHPDTQWHFFPGLVTDHGRASSAFHAFQIHIGTLRPLSRGFLSLQSRNPKDHILIEANYMSEEQDVADLRACVRQAREVVGQRAFDPFRGDEISPGPHVSSDDDIDEFLRNMCETAYHPAGTCKMGPRADSFSVIDPSTMGVWGTENLKVVDASVMPSIVSGNLNASVVMMGEKASDILMGNPPLTPTKAPVYETDRR